MRIYWYWPWPADRAPGLATGAARPGDHLTVQCLTETAAAERLVTTDGVRFVADLRRPGPPNEGSLSWAIDRSRMLAQRARARARAVRELHPDICHVHVTNLLIDPLTLPRLASRTALVTSVHDVEPHHRRLPPRLERLAMRHIVRQGSKVIVYHDYLRIRLEEEHGVPAERIVVIPHPVRACTRARPYGSSSAPTVLFFGALRRNKGLEVLLDAIQLIHEDVRFVVAGRGVRALEEMATQAAAGDDRIEAHIGYIPNARRAELFDEADLVVLPYTAFASQSGVLADAYAARVPVVGSDVGALGPSIREDGSGWTVPPGDARSLATRIVEALSDEAGRSRISERIGDHADARSEQATGRRFREVYEAVTSG